MQSTSSQPGLVEMMAEAIAAANPVSFVRTQPSGTTAKRRLRWRRIDGEWVAWPAARNQGYGYIIPEPMPDDQLIRMVRP